MSKSRFPLPYFSKQILQSADDGHLYIRPTGTRFFTPEPHFLYFFMISTFRMLKTRFPSPFLTPKQPHKPHHKTPFSTPIHHSHFLLSPPISSQPSFPHFFNIWERFEFELRSNITCQLLKLSLHLLTGLTAFKFSLTATRIFFPINKLSNQRSFAWKTQRNQPQSSAIAVPNFPKYEHL